MSALLVSILLSRACAHAHARAAHFGGKMKIGPKTLCYHDNSCVQLKLWYTYRVGDEKKLCHRKLSALIVSILLSRARAHARARARILAGKWKLGQKHEKNFFWKIRFFAKFRPKTWFLENLIQKMSFLGRFWEAILKLKTCLRFCFRIAILAQKSHLFRRTQALRPRGTRDGISRAAP